MSNDCAPQKTVQERLRDLIAQHNIQGWDKAWKEQITPWDAGDVQPPLRDLLSSGELKIAPAGRALVPGCGRGYDAIYIASTTGLDALAVDISPTAVEAANELVVKDQVPSMVNVKFELKDFFTLGESEDEKFDLVYDYTFFVAIPPARRAEWGQIMSRLVKPGGYLITLVFPMDPPQDYGPPFFVRPEHYDAVLGDGWEKIIDKVPEVSSKTHTSRERLVVRKKL